MTRSSVAPSVRRNAAARSSLACASAHWRSRTADPASDRARAPARPAKARNRCVCGRRRNGQTRDAAVAAGATEAAASGNAILGQAPTDPAFVDLFGADAVAAVPFDNGDLSSLWDRLWEKRNDYLNAALRRRASLAHKWTWESRINEILTLMNAN